MDILKYLDKDNLHHAYLIEGSRDEVVPEIKKFIESLGIQTIANPDFSYISVDSFKVEDARNLKSFSNEKGISSAKKIFIISVNSFLLEAQNSLLKIFEEPIENTHFFLVVPDTNSLLKTLVSRFYVIKPKAQFEKAEFIDAEKFISMSLSQRINFIKELLADTEEEDEEGNGVIVQDSARSKALKFLNILETILYKKGVDSKSKQHFEHLFKVREFLRMPGSSAKSLMESVALVIPI